MITDYLRARDPGTPTFDALRACLQDHAAAMGGEPAAAEPPDKVVLAECLAEVATRTWYQPEEIRRIAERLALFTELSVEQSLIPEGDTAEPFTVNRRFANEEDLHGHLALTIIPDLWLLDLASLSVRRLSDQATGPPCWSPDGGKIAFPSRPSQDVRNSEAITVHDFTTDEAVELLGVGHYFCWGGDHRLYANSLQSGGYKIHVTQSAPNKPLTVMDTERGTLVGCVDRKRQRILVGEQGRFKGRRVCSVLRINDLKRVWDGEKAGMAASEWTAGAFSPDGQQISWPQEGAGNETGGLHVAGVTGSGDFRRLTPPVGSVMSSTWSPQGRYVAFPWSLWSGDSIRIWVVDTDTQVLTPLIEGPFGDDGLRSLGCHSWRG